MVQSAQEKLAVLESFDKSGAISAGQAVTTLDINNGQFLRFIGINQRLVEGSNLTTIQQLFVSELNSIPNNCRIEVTGAIEKLTKICAALRGYSRLIKQCYANSQPAVASCNDIKKKVYEKVKSVILFNTRADKNSQIQRTFISNDQIFQNENSWGVSVKWCIKWLNNKKESASSSNGESGSKDRNQGQIPGLAGIKAQQTLDINMLYQQQGSSSKMSGLDIIADVMAAFAGSGDLVSSSTASVASQAPSAAALASDAQQAASAAQAFGKNLAGKKSSPANLFNFGIKHKSNKDIAGTGPRDLNSPDDPKFPNNQIDNVKKSDQIVFEPVAIRECSRLVSQTQEFFCMGPTDDSLTIVMKAVLNDMKIKKTQGAFVVCLSAHTPSKYVSDQSGGGQAMGCAYDDKTSQWSFMDPNFGEWKGIEGYIVDLIKLLACLYSLGGSLDSWTTQLLKVKISDSK